MDEGGYEGVGGEDGGAGEGEGVGVRHCGCAGWVGECKGIKICEYREVREEDMSVRG